MPREKAVGQDFRSLVEFVIKSSHGNAVVSSLEAGIDTMIGTDREVSIRCRDGTTRWGSMAVSKISNAGQFFYVAFVRNTTGQRQQRERFQQVAKVVGETDAAIIVAGIDGRITYANGAVTRLLGYEPDELKGRWPSDMFFGHHTSVEAARLIRAATDRAASLSGFRQEILIYTKAGKPLWISAVINAVRDDAGNLLNLIGVLTDITLTKMHEEVQQKVLNAMVCEMPTEDVARLLCSEVERVTPNVVCSIIEVDAEGRLAMLVAPTLPEFLAQWINDPDDRTSEWFQRDGCLARRTCCRDGH